MKDFYVVTRGDVFVLQEDSDGWQFKPNEVKQLLAHRLIVDDDGFYQTVIKGTSFMAAENLLIDNREDYHVKCIIVGPGIELILSPLKNNVRFNPYNVVNHGF